MGVAGVGAGGGVSTGTCKICMSSLSRQFNKRLARGDSYPQIIAWAADNDFKISKPTLIQHKRHITDPKTTAVEQARKNPVIKRTSHEEFLQMLVDAGAAMVTENPGNVSMDHAIRAAQTLATKGDKQRDIILVLAERLSPKALPVIEGDWREIDEHQSDTVGLLSES